MSEAIDRLTSMWCSAELNLEDIYFIEKQIEEMEDENEKLRSVVEAVWGHLRSYDGKALENLVVALNALEADDE